MDVEWDEAKRRCNLEKHGIDFQAAKEIWRGPVLEVPSLQTGHGEARFLAIGQLHGQIVTAIFTWRGDIRRRIRARRARLDEREHYTEQIRGDL